MPKDTLKKVKRKPTGQGKIFRNYILNKGVIFKVYKEFLQLNNRKTTQFLSGLKSFKLKDLIDTSSRKIRK